MLLSEMARQCKLTKGQFVELVDCPLSRAEYEQVLVRSGELPSAPPQVSTTEAPTPQKRRVIPPKDRKGTFE